MGVLKKLRKKVLAGQKYIGIYTNQGEIKMSNYDEDYDSCIIERLKQNPALIPEYLKVALEDFDNDDDIRLF